VQASGCCRKILKTITDYFASLNGIVFSRDAENSSREIVPQNTNTPDEFVAERVFPDIKVKINRIGVPRSAPRRG